MTVVDPEVPTSKNSPKSEKGTLNRKRLLTEIAILGVLYAIYTLARNKNEASESIAFSNAKDIISYEKFLHLYFEQPIHEFFMRYDFIIIAANYFYGSFHFIVTIFAMVYVFTTDPKRYSRVRNTIVVGTLIALVGFITYPLMPPRLLPASYGFVDTLAKFPAFWSFNSKEFATISNQFAAMPSVHILWSTWCVFALYPYVKKQWVKIMLVAYPICTLFVIIVTSNHYWLDAVGGILIFAIAYWVSRMITSLTTRSAIDKTESLADIIAK